MEQTASLVNKSTPQVQNNTASKRMSRYGHGLQMLVSSNKGQTHSVNERGKEIMGLETINRFSNLRDNDPGNLCDSQRIMTAGDHAIPREAVKNLK